MPDLCRQSVGSGGIPVCATNFRGALHNLHNLPADRLHQYVCFCESNMFFDAQRNSKVADALQRASLVLPDGTTLVAMARRLGRLTAKLIPGTLFLLPACQHDLERGYRHFFLRVAEGVAERLTERSMYHIRRFKLWHISARSFVRPPTTKKAISKRWSKSLDRAFCGCALAGPSREYAFLKRLFMRLWYTVRAMEYASLVD